VTRPRRRATYNDLLRVPEPLVAEIIDGELITSPRPAVPHAHAAWWIAQEVGPFSRDPASSGTPGAPGGWWILFEPELHLGEDVLVPDLAGWRRERLPALPDTAAIEQAPDWACEVLSPSTEAVDRARKMRVYARESVGHLWLVDPIVRTLEVYRLEGGRWMVSATHGGAEVVRAEPFAARELDLGRWWLARPAQPAT
jgi:Uma2 family endonuclease